MVDDYVIRAENLSKSFVTREGSFLAVKNINLKVGNKQIVCLMGPSSCGKSTTLNMLGGIIQPSSGKISYYNTVYEKGIPRDALKGIGFVFQSDNLLPWRTVENNLHFPLEIFKLNDQKWRNRIYDLLEMVGLSEYKNYYPHELSGGMRQRIGIIRALVHDPEILLMDQPFGALDAITRKMLNYDFLSLWEKSKKSILLVTNDIDEALLLSSKVLMMSDLPGEILYEIDVDIPLHERNHNITKNKRYNELRLNLKHLFSKI